MTMTRDERRAWITSKLDPIDAYDPSLDAARSDFDLNPSLRPDNPHALRPAAVLVGLVEREAGMTVLRLDPDGYHLVTPVEKLKIQVEDAPFIATRVDQIGDLLRFETNVGDVVEAGPANAIRVETDPATGEPRPYLHVRRGLEALIARPVFYELAELSAERDTPEGPRLGVASNGAWFPIAPAGAHRS